MLNRKQPRNDDRYQWTHHVVDKMRYYGLSESRVRRVLAAPKRSEEGVAPRTIAVMQPDGTTKKPHEIWVMYQPIQLKAKNEKLKVVELLKRQTRPVRKRIITAWRYPGISKPRGPVPVPDEILQELDNLV